MRKIMFYFNRLVKVAIVLILAFFVVVTLMAYWSDIKDLPLRYSSKPFKEYQEIIRKIDFKKEKVVINISRIQSVDWDEAVLWTPYMDICQLNIKGISDNPNYKCKYQAEDSVHILLLKEKELVAKIPAKEFRYFYEIKQENYSGKMGALIKLSKPLR